MDQQVSEKQTLQEKIAAVKKIKHRTDGGRKLKNLPKEVKDALKKAEQEAKVPPKVTKKRKKQAKKKEEKELPPPLCRYVEGIVCIYAERRWKGSSKDFHERDRLDRPKSNVFCKTVCLPLVMGKHQTVSLFSVGVTLTKQMSQIIAALNITAGAKQPMPEIGRKKHPSAPETSLRQMREDPDNITKKPE